MKLIPQKLEGRGYCFNRFSLIHPCDRQTDRQTDGRAITYSVLCICAVAR